MLADPGPSFQGYVDVQFDDAMTENEEDLIEAVVEDEN